MSDALNTTFLQNEVFQTAFIYLEIFLDAVVNISDGQSPHLALGHT